MSRSYKKTPRAGDNKSTRGYKAIFNKAERRRPITEDDSSSRSEYKKRHKSWEICDYQDVGTSFEDYYKVCIGRYKISKAVGSNRPKPDRDKCYKEWYKMYKSK